MSQETPDAEVPAARPSILQEMRTSEDWWAVWVGSFLLLVAFLSVALNVPDGFFESARDGTEELAKPSSALKSVVAKPGSWTANPIDALYKSSSGGKNLTGTIGMFCGALVLFAFALQLMGRSAAQFVKGFWFVFLLSVLAYIMAGQATVKYYSLSYALWALLVGMLISNTVGVPAFAKPAILTEFYIKTGLVLFGAEILLGLLLGLGLPGIFVAWVVTPVVLISTYIFGQKILKIESRSLNMVIAADMSVCGVSAAIATAAACKAKKEELTFAIGLSLTFTVIMMIALPAFIRFVGMSEVLGGAWLGGTIDATGAVAAAGDAVGPTAEKVAATVKIIQNVLIGVTAFGVAVYWVTCVEPGETGVRPNPMEIWYRFPKFVIGFLAASAVFSAVYSYVPGGDLLVKSMIGDVTKTLRGWFFCLAFVSIGLETNFREFKPYLKGGKPTILYVCGQSLNIVLTLLMAWLMFEVVFRDQVEALIQ